MEYTWTNSRKLEYSDFLSLLDEQDIIILIETWKRNNLLKPINNKKYFDMNYSLCRKAETAKRGSGGISVFIRTYIRNFISYIQSDAEEMLWSKLSKLPIKQDRRGVYCTYIT